jgi:hypothetical protein
MTVTVALLDTAEARRLTERIRIALDRVSNGWADLAERVAEAYTRRADLALGYDSWEAYASVELRPSEGIAAEVRRELVGLLSARGMSIRAIAPTLGVTKSQVSRDGTPDERIDPVTGEIVPAPTFGAVDVTDWTNDEITEDLEVCEAETAHWEETTVPAPKITGLDGKTYARPTPVAAAPRRRPITDAFWEAAYDLGKKAESLLRLVEDDRWASNRDAVADKNLVQMRETANTLARVLAALTENSQGE